ncbi:SGNH/GDSL hydrolase family protein [soil metagenome]
MKKIALFLALSPVFASAQFALKDGDRVVFYGDSITDQRLYTYYTETFVRTRFPGLKVSFVHSGWGGDRVTGGGGGDIDTRLTRDVLAYKPTVVTVMLGMNDASYRAFDQGIFDTFAKGYAHIVDRLKKEDPGVRLTLIQPSPFDDVTRPLSYPGGYNAVLVQYGNYVKELGMRNGATIADLNTPVVRMLEKANATDPESAQKIINDRVHPGDAGHLTMAGALLKAWNAPSVVASLTISDGRVANASNTAVTDFSAKGGTLSWTQKDDALPFPLNLKDPMVQLVVGSSDFLQALDQEMLTANVPAGQYDLTIDGKKVGMFSSDELAKGINLATMDTPMRAQAQTVADLVRARTEAHNQRWRSIQTNWLFANQGIGAKERDAAMRDLDRYDAALDAAARKAAQPVAHRFGLMIQP